MSIAKLVYLVIIAILFNCQPIFAQTTSINKLKREADESFDKGQYVAALEQYIVYDKYRPNIPEVYLNMGICYFETNQLLKAQNYLGHLASNGGKVGPDVYFHLALVLHHSHNFDKAVDYYKLYLRETRLNDERRSFVKAQVLRCGNGLVASLGSSNYIVENAGPTVNSEYDEIKPVYSPNVEERIYFSTSSMNTVDGDGKRDFNMMGSELMTGSWSPLQPLNSKLNTEDQEILQGFNLDGTIAFFLRGERISNSRVFADTFSSNSQIDSLGSLHRDIRLGDSQVRDLLVINDTIVLFASDHPAGYGGFDLYYMIKRGEKWADPTNLGNVINTPYDEVSPFLTKNGRKLFYSSNNSLSIGGFDIFSAIFDDTDLSWIELKNEGLPLNSAGNDLDFCLRKDAFGASFSSDRKEGSGGFDIYSVYFHDQEMSHLRPGFPAVFILALEQRGATSEDSPISGVQFTEEKNKVIEVEISPLFYQEDIDIFNDANKKQLEKVAEILKAYPSSSLLISSFSDYEGPVNLDLYFCLKRGESVKQFLFEKGCRKSQIDIKAMGTQYPMVNRQINGQVVNSAKTLNSRIDLRIYFDEAVNISVKYQDIKPDRDFLHQSFKRWEMNNNGVSYKVQIVSTTKILNDPILQDYSDPMVEQNSESEYYRYSLGLYKTFSSAYQLRELLRKGGFADAFIVPYVDGRRLKGEEANKFASEYPELINYLRSTKQ
jgi:outer membrane protein OmpA-like peptidoglycan-associated protein